jgi:holo-[acyl-carrier protein] synthase
LIKGIGTDLVKIKRIEESYAQFGDKFALRILTTTEFEAFKAKEQKINYLAKRFAAKEAVSKALGTGIGENIGFQDIEISNNSLGAPTVTILSNVNLGIANKLKFHLSLTDEKEYAQAFAVCEYT